MHSRSRALIGLLLVAAGAIFLLDAAGVVSVGRLVSGWWPIILVVVGLLAITRRPRSWTGGSILIVIGGLLLLSTLDVLDLAFWQLIVPLVLIGAGVSLVIRGFGGGQRGNQSPVINLTAVLSEQDVQSVATAFRRASLTTLLGELKLDLRNATLDPSGAEIDTTCILGETIIYVPRGWHVQVNGVPILGEFVDRTEREQELPPGAPRLLIDGVAILGEISVRHG